MESEVNEFASARSSATAVSRLMTASASTVATEKPSDSIAVAGCEEILLPTDSVTNGITNISTGSEIAFLEENDPMGDINDTGAGGHDTEAQHIETQLLAEEYAEESEEGNEKNDDVEEDADEEEEGEEEEEEEENIVEHHEEEEDGEEEVGEATVTQKERAPTQVPKKRKDAAIFALTIEEEGDEGDAEDFEQARRRPSQIEEVLPDEGVEVKLEQEELPTSSARAAANKENSVDEEQCRVCTTTHDLVSLFKKIEQQTVAEMLMTICPTVAIARKDFMPQYICSNCLDNVSIAVQLKSQCETTERELRKKLSRHKNKVRRPTGYVVIDAPVESDPASEEDEEPADDAEFKVSDVEVSASADDSDSDDSDFGSKKKRVSRGGVSKRGRRKSAVTPTPKQGEKKRIGRPPIKRALGSSDDEALVASTKKKKESNSGDKGVMEFPCDECEQVFTRKLSLVLHKKVHSNGPPICCKLCGKQFKIQGAYRTHLERHQSESSNHSCNKCDMFFTTKADLRKHLTDEHNEQREEALHCPKCKRCFVSHSRLTRHMQGFCPGLGTVAKPKKTEYESLSSGKDLFKAVAPLTTTYWSDSFSD